MRIRRLDEDHEHDQLCDQYWLRPHLPTPQRPTTTTTTVNWGLQLVLPAPDRPHELHPLGVPAPPGFLPSLRCGRCRFLVVVAGRIGDVCAWSIATH